jgi:predicted P-loop ATPase
MLPNISNESAPTISGADQLVGGYLDMPPLVQIPSPAQISPARPESSAGGLAPGRAVDLIGAALQYARDGWYVFPIADDSKVPITSHGHLDATIDEAQIRSWWTAHPTARIGVHLRASGLIAVDVDVADGKPGAETLAALEAKHGPLPRTNHQRSGRGGEHIVMRDPSPGADGWTRRHEDGGSARGKLGRGVDLKINGYIVLEPSGSYRWIAHDPMNVAAVPDAWIPLMRHSTEDRSIGDIDPNVWQESTHELDDLDAAKLREELRALGARGADRTTTFKAIRLVHHDYGLSVADGMVYIQEWNSSCGKPHSDRELARQIKRVSRCKPNGANVEMRRGWKCGLESFHSWTQELIATRSGANVNASALAVQDDDETRAPSDDEIRALLLMSGSKGDVVRSCGSNIEAILRFSSELRGRVRFNVITRSIEISDGRFVDEEGTLDTAIKNWLETRWGLFSDQGEVGHQLIRVAMRCGSYDPVAEYLNALTWDGKPRIDSWLCDYCEVLPSDYVSKIGARWLISGAARGLDPGCKVDTVLILQGPQGYRKSTVLDVIGGEWFSDSPLDITNKDSRITAATTWIIELAELSSLKQSGLDAHKSFLTARRDKVRPPYGRVDVTFYRHCIYGGTTNDDEFLIDETGNRRYWVARVRRKIDIAPLQRDRDQLWAEAVHRFRAGERWWFDDEEQVIADQVTDEHRAENPWAEKIVETGKRRGPKPAADGAPDGAVKLVEVADWLGIEFEDIDKHKARVAAALRAAGYERRQFGERRVAWWCPPWWRREV